MLNYYFLTPTEQSVFNDIRIQAKRCDGKITVKYTKRISQILDAMRYDCPETFSVNWYTYNWVEYKKVESIVISYTPTCNVPNYEMIIRRANQLLQNINGKTEWAKVKQVHDVIINIAGYDTIYYDSLRINSSNYNPHRHSIYGLLAEGKTVCEGVAQLMNFLLNKLGIFCYVVCGKILKTGEHHAWNIVKIENDYYHIDTTFNMGLTVDKKNIRYDYFCLDDNAIGLDRQFTNEDAEYIKCSSTRHEYYRCQNLFVEKKEQLSSLFERNRVYLKNISFRVTDNVTEAHVLNEYKRAIGLFGLIGRSISYSRSDTGVYSLGLN